MPNFDDLPDVDRIVRPTVCEVEAIVRQATGEGPAELVKAVRHLTDAGGKRIRPTLVALCSVAVRGRIPPELKCVAAAAELLHTATLLHDDVLDEGDMRRCRPAARVLWGNCVSVLGGDYLLVQALRLVLRSAASLLERTFAMLDEMVAAEVLQLQIRHELRFDSQTTLRVIHGKTASVFGWCASAAARHAGEAGLAESFEAFGRHFGMAFQIVDDINDLLEHTPGRASKTVLGDLRSGTITLPVALAVSLSPCLADRLRQAARDGCVAAALALEVRATGALAQAAEVVRHECRQALHALEEGPDSPARQALAGVVGALVQAVASLDR